MKPLPLALSLSKGVLCALPLLLAACNSAEEKTPDQAAGESTQAPAKSADGNELIECAIAGAQWFLRECEVEKTRDEGGALVLVVHHPDGGFRRFAVLTDGRGLEPADGAERAMSEVIDGRLDVQVGNDRYRFPVTVKGDDAAQ